MRGNRERQPGDTHSGVADDSRSEDALGDALTFETVILPARLDAHVARRVAIAASRDGISIADLLGRAAAAYDWGVEDDAPA